MSDSDVEKARYTNKALIPRALREQVWYRTMGAVYKGKCVTTWCQNEMTVFDFQAGHCIPESKGGATTIDNLLPLCSRCNLSMSNNYTIAEWSAMFQAPPKQTRTWFQNCCGCFLSAPSRTTNGQEGSTKDAKDAKDAKEAVGGKEDT